MAEKPTVFVDELPPGVAASAHTVATLVEVLDGGEPQREIDAVVDGAVTYDASQSSRAQLSLTVVDDGSGDLVVKGKDSLLAPYGREIRIARGVERPEELLLVRMGTYQIRRPTTSDDGVTQIAALDRSAWVRDAKFEEPYNVEPGTLVLDAITDVVEQAALPFAFEMDFIDLSAELPALIAEEGDDRWDFALGLAKAVGCELYWNRNGDLALRRIPLQASGNPVAAFAEGPGGVLLGAERDWDRDAVTNKWIVTGENVGLEDVPRGVAADLNENSPTYYHGSFGRRPDTWNSTFITTDDQAADAAAGLLARTTGRPDMVGFRVAVDPARRPFDVVRIARDRLGVDEDHVLDQVVIPVGPGEMSGRTRATERIT